MITEAVGSYLETGSSRFSYTTNSGNISGCLTIAPHSGASLYPAIGLNETKFSFIVISGGIPIAQIDNDHPIEVSGSHFRGLHQHTLVSGSTVQRVPVERVKSVAESGSLVQALWEGVL